MPAPEASVGAGVSLINPKTGLYMYVHTELCTPYTVLLLLLLRIRGACSYEGMRQRLSMLKPKLNEKQKALRCE